MGRGSCTPYRWTPCGYFGVVFRTDADCGHAAANRRPGVRLARQASVGCRSSGSPRARFSDYACVTLGGGTVQFIPSPPAWCREKAPRLLQTATSGRGSFSIDASRGNRPSLRAARLRCSSVGGGRRIHGARARFLSGRLLMHHYKLVPELEEWDAHNGGEMDPEGWAACMGSYSLACGYASLFWPHFTEAAGVVVRGPTDEAYVLSWLAGDNVNRQQVEATINHLHLLDVQHPGVYETVTDEQLSFLGKPSGPLGPPSWPSIFRDAILWWSTTREAPMIAMPMWSPSMNADWTRQDAQAPVRWGRIARHEGRWVPGSPPHENDQPCWLAGRPVGFGCLHSPGRFGRCRRSHARANDGRLKRDLRPICSGHKKATSMGGCLSRSEHHVNGCGTLLCSYSSQHVSA